MNKKAYALILLLIAPCPEYLAAQSVEYTIKASLIEKLARFTEWGKELTGDYFVIDVLGESPFNGELERLAQKIRIKNKAIKINYLDNYQDVSDCQLLFICSSEKKNLPAIVKHIAHFDILSISDTPESCAQGTHLDFFMDDSQKIRYEVNPTALRKSHLTVDMQLLSFGKIVGQ